MAFHYQRLSPACLSRPILTLLTPLTLSLFLTLNDVCIKTHNSLSGPLFLVLGADSVHTEGKPG